MFILERDESFFPWLCNVPGIVLLFCKIPTMVTWNSITLTPQFTDEETESRKAELIT